MLGLSWLLLSLLAATAHAGTVVWSGSFNNFTSSADFDKWSWSNQVEPYQWYIHGSQPTSRYLALDAAYKNPAHTSELRGLKLTIDTTATWNSQMQRAELIPQTTANLGSGNLFYHFSVKRTNTNPPDPSLEHQVMFFESHFTELKYGVGSNPGNLVWMIGGQEKWGTPFTADTWFNFAYDIDFGARTVGLWASTGSNPLARVVANQAASTSTDSKDFHVGVLRIVNRNPPEDWYFSNVYIERGPITTAQGSGSSNPGTTTTSTTPTTTTTTTTVTTPTVPAGPQQSLYGQCGGTGWTGPTVCAPPATCVAVAAPFYSQCQ
ncbi:hypothetical protein H1R20_g6194, partial [Candolleomyces eurysporus]